MIPFPLPPVLARLHELLEGYTESQERGFFLAEQDRTGQVQAQPVLIFITPRQLNAEPAPGEQPPAWMGEVTTDDAGTERRQRYAKAGVFEYWRVLGVDDGAPRIEVHQGPQADGSYETMKTFAAEDVVETKIFTKLELRPQDLLAS